MDPGYSTFLNLLQRPNDTLQSLPKTTIYGAVVHYMKVLPHIHLPIFVRALLLSRTLWATKRRSHLSGCQAAVRQAVRTKLALIKETSQGGFLSGPDIQSPFKEWTNYILKGLSETGKGLRSEIHARLALTAGLLQGLNDVELDIKVPRLRSRAEEDVVAAMAAAMEISNDKDSEWGGEFESIISGEEGENIT